MLSFMRMPTAGLSTSDRDHTPRDQPALSGRQIGWRLTLSSRTARPELVGAPLATAAA